MKLRVTLHKLVIDANMFFPVEIHILEDLIALCVALKKSISSGYSGAV